jgi:glucose 1-dehydrogenase/3-oxoacyl-[acyl-carrier protein] reductase
MKGRKVVVTGSANANGRGIALEFARAGADVVIHYAHSKEQAQTALTEIRAQGVRAEAYGADFAEVDAAKGFGTRALDFLGGLDVLVNSAGITMNLPFEKVTSEQFDVLYSVNVRAQFFLTQTVLPALLRATHPAIVNITSIHAFEGYTEHSVYAGTKGAIVAYTRELAVELAPRGIRVNAIAPGAVPVENHYKVIKDFDPAASGRSIPIGHAGTPEDIGKLAVFLASEDARYIVGQTIIADGGTTSWMPFSDGFRKPGEMHFGKGYVPGI